MYARKFTLIEMLVVIAIISILASLLMPSLQNSLNGARGTKCRSNMRQFGIAHSMYIQDNNGWTVVAYRNPRFWYQIFVNFYELSREGVACPTEQYFRYTPQGVNYGLNTLTFSETENSKGLKPKRATEISSFGRNSRLIVFIDTPPVWSGTSSIRNSSANAAYWESTAKIAGVDSSSSDWYPAYARHEGMLNTAMFDGGAQAINGLELWLNRADYCNPRMNAWGDGKLAIRNF